MNPNDQPIGISNKRTKDLINWIGKLTAGHRDEIVKI